MFILKFALERPDGAACELAFEIDVTLIACYQLTEHSFDAAMRAPKLNHPLCEWRAPKISIKAVAHL